MRLILQVLGRLSGYKKVEFIVDEGEPVKDYLSSRALAKRLGSSEIILLVPESLVTEVASDEDEAKELLSSREKLANRVSSKLRSSELLEDGDGLWVVQSVGTYPANEKFRINFLNTVDNVVASLIFDLLELERIKKHEEIILDISTGHNIYTTSLIDVARTLVVYFKLERIISGEKVPKFKIAYSPPILESISYPIRYYDFDVKAFFDLPSKKPIKIEELLKDKENKELRKEISTNFENEKVEFIKLINETKIAYNAIRYNVPLAYFDDKIVSFEIDEEEALNELRSVLRYITEGKKEQIRKDEGTIVIKRPSVEKTLFANLLLTVAFHKALKEFKGRLKKKSSVSVILEEFKPLYEKIGLGLNSRFLERDAKEIEELLQYLDEKTEEPVTLKELKKRKLIKSLSQFQNTKENKKGRKEGDIKRNFFAHSGFEETITLIKQQNGEGYLCYKLEEKEEIKKWLENPED